MPVSVLDEAIASTVAAAVAKVPSPPQAPTASDGRAKPSTQLIVNVTCVVAVFVVSFILLCAIQPPATKSKDESHNPNTAPTFSVAKAAAGAGVVTGVSIIALIAIYFTTKPK